MKEINKGFLRNQKCKCKLQSKVVSFVRNSASLKRTELFLFYFYVLFFFLFFCFKIQKYAFRLGGKAFFLFFSCNAGKGMHVILVPTIIMSLFLAFFLSLFIFFFKKLTHFSLISFEKGNSRTVLSTVMYEFPMMLSCMFVTCRENHSIFNALLHFFS